MGSRLSAWDWFVVIGGLTVIIGLMVASFAFIVWAASVELRAFFEDLRRR